MKFRRIKKNACELRRIHENLGEFKRIEKMKFNGISNSKKFSGIQVDFGQFKIIYKELVILEKK